MPIFTVEGVVGAGKSSLLETLKLAKFAKEHIIVFEPVDEWMNTRFDGPDGPSIFEQYYADKKRYGFVFQMLALQTRVNSLIKVAAKHPGAIIICERSHISDCEIFARMLKDMDIMSNAEYGVYKAWYDMCNQHMFNDFAGVIYIDTTPGTCIERIMHRGRSGEEHISFDYIGKLHALHESWIASTTLPICKVDGNIVNKDSEKYQSEIVGKIVTFCNSF